MGQTFTPLSYPLPHIKASAMGIFTLDNGVIVNYFGSQGSRGDSIGWFGRIELFGEKGGMYRGAYGRPYVVMQNDRLKRKRKLKRVSRPLDRYEKIAFLLEDFYQAIINDRPPITDLHENVHTFAMLMGLKKAAFEVRMVDIQKEFSL
jgi:predicted dehydrogenase